MILDFCFRKSMLNYKDAFGISGGRAIEMGPS